MAFIPFKGGPLRSQTQMETAVFEVFMAAKIQTEVFWIVTPYGDDILPPTTLHGIKTQKTSV
jgi:hypothetical protein